MTAPAFDLSFRPASYFRPRRLEDHLASRIGGQLRREAVKAALEAGEPVPDALLEPALDPVTLDLFTSGHPALLGGEFLPSPERGEVEIARISLASVTADQFVVRARRAGKRIRYGVHDEYDDEYVASDFRPRSSTQPLTMGRLIDLIASAYDVYGCIDANIEGGSSADQMARFVTVRSDFYPELGRYYAESIAEWLAENHPAEEDEDCDADDEEVGDEAR